MKNAPSAAGSEIACGCVWTWVWYCLNVRVKDTFKSEFVFQFLHHEGVWVSETGSPAVMAPASRSQPSLAEHTDLAYPAWLNTQYTGRRLSEACSTAGLIHTRNYTNAHRPLIRTVCRYCVCAHMCLCSRVFQIICSINTLYQKAGERPF